MQITRLSAAECEDLYRSALPRDFPAAELKPFAEIQRLLESGVYEPLLLTDDAGARLAYAWQVVLPGQRTALLDYFAVRYDLRGSGVGTALHTPTFRVDEGCLLPGVALQCLSVMALLKEE